MRLAKLFIGALALLTLGCSTTADAGRLRLIRRGIRSAIVLGPVTYDTSIGNGVGTDGFASLPLNTGAHRYYVNSSTGSDANGCTSSQNPATPLATLTAGESCATNGLGDQILLAEGTSYSSFTMIGAKGGASPVYPLVIESYNVSDPTNELKLGRASGSNRPVILTSGMSGGFIQGSGVQKYRAFRGLKFDAQNAGNANTSILDASSGEPDYTLFENDEFAQIQLTVQASSGTIKKLIIRNCSSHGQWGSNRAQGLFADHVDGLTVEDSVWWHNGWKEGANRTDDPSIGGASSQSHSLYIQDTTSNVIVRRNVMIDVTSEGANLKGGGIIQGNLSLRNPIVFSNGGGNNATIDIPFGVYDDTSFNAAIGSNQITTGGAQNWGIIAQYSRSGSLIRYNVLALSNLTSAEGLIAEAGNDVITSNTQWTPPTVPAAIPSFPTYDHNVLYQWGASGTSQWVGPQNLSLITATYTNNLWDDPTSGTNTNNSGAAFPSAYTEATLLSALGYPDETTAINDWIANTPSHGWERGAPLVLAGYGITTPALSDLSTDMRITAGIANAGQFIGTQDGDTLTFSGLPSCVTPDSDARAWRATSSCTTGSGTFSVTETPPTGPPHTTNIAWNVYPQPVLSGLSVTPGANSATATISTTVGSGKLYWMVSASSTPPNWAEIKDGIDASLTSAAYVFGSQAITASGTQSINTTTGHTSTALTTGNIYTLHVAQLDGNNNPSATSSATFTSN